MEEVIVIAEASDGKMNTSIRPASEKTRVEKLDSWSKKVICSP